MSENEVSDNFVNMSENVVSDNFFGEHTRLTQSTIAIPGCPRLSGGKLLVSIENLLHNIIRHFDLLNDTQPGLGKALRPLLSATPAS